MPVYQSQWEEGAGFNKTEFTGYDSESGIRYQVSNDESHLYLTFDTDSRSNLINILRSGAKIYIDTNSKKKGTASLTFPYIRRSGEGRQMPAGRRSDQGNRRPDYKTMNKRIMGLSEGLWTWGESEIFIDLQLENSEFDGLMRIDSAGNLQYYVAIPFHSIKTSAIDEIAMGIEIEPPSGSSQGMYSRGRGQMGMGGGRPDGGRPPDGGGYGRPEGQRPDPSMFESDPVKIWFKVRMATK